MSYGLNIEMHKQVGGARLFIFFSPPLSFCSHLKEIGFYQPQWFRSISITFPVVYWQRRLNLVIQEKRGPSSASGFKFQIQFYGELRNDSTVFCQQLVSVCHSVMCSPKVFLI